MTWLEQAVRTSRLKQLGVCGLIFAVIALAIAFNYRYLENVYRGPYDIPRVELLATPSATELPRYWVNLKTDKVLDTGIDQITIRKRKGFETGRSVTGHYYAGVVGDRLLLVKSHGEKIGTEPIKGGLVDVPSDLIDRLSGQNAGIRKAFLPVMLDTGPFESDATWGLGAAASVAGVTLLFALFALFRYFNPNGHKALRQLEKSGQSTSGASASIKADMDARRYLRLKDYRLTTQYAVKQGLGLDVVPLRELVWAHPTVTQHKIYGIIPTGKSYGLTMTFKSKPITEKVAKGVPEAAMEHLARWSPWSFLGYSDQLADALKRRRKDVLAAVDERYEIAMNAVAQDPPVAAPNPPATTPPSAPHSPAGNGPS